MTSKYQPGGISKLFSAKNSGEIDKSLFETPPQHEFEPESLVVQEKPSKKRKKTSVEIPEQMLTTSSKEKRKKKDKLQVSFEKPAIIETDQLEAPIKKVKRHKKTKKLGDQGDTNEQHNLPVIKKDPDEPEVPTKKGKRPKKIKNLQNQGNVDEQNDLPVVKKDPDEPEVLTKKGKRPKKIKNLQNQGNVDEQHDLPVIKKDPDELEVTSKKAKRPKKIKNLLNQGNVDEKHDLPGIKKDLDELEVTSKEAKALLYQNNEDEKPLLPFVEKPMDDPEKMARTLFVGNLPTSFSRKQIKALFSKYGKIESARIRNAVPGKPNLTKKIAVITKTFHEDRNSINAYVVFKSQDKAQEALELNGLAIEGNHIRVDFANNKEHDHSRSIFVGNLPFGLEDDELRNFFNDCGKVESVRIIRDKATGAGKGFGYVLFQSKDSVLSALKKHEGDLAGRSIRVFRAKKERIKHPGRPKGEARQSEDTENNFQSKVKQPIWLRKSIPNNSGGIRSFEGVRSVEDVKERLKIQRNIKTSAIKSHKNTINGNSKVQKKEEINESTVKKRFSLSFFPPIVTKFLLYLI